MFSNDNGSPKRSGLGPIPDPDGQAALLLVESLIHGLCENKTLDTQQAIEIAERALEVQFEQAEATDDDIAAPMWRSHQLLTAITASLKVDVQVTKPAPDPIPYPDDRGL